MYKILSGIFIIFLLFALVACTLPDETTGPVAQPVQTIAETELGRMLGYVPYAFLEENDIWYTDPGTIKQHFGLENMDSVENIRNLEGEKGKKFLNKLSAIPIAQSYTFRYQLEPLIGWDWLQIDRSIFNETPPPWGFSVVEGDFNETLIGEKLTEQGYAKSEYGSFTYYHINGDMQIDLESELGRMVLAQINRVAILDDTLVVAPATDILTSILDAIARSEISVEAVFSARAIADSLGDVQGAVLITPDRVSQLDPDTTPSFDLPDAANWGMLHDYSLFGTGYRDDGSERYWIISLYYDDKEAAITDADELVSRLRSYIFNTHLKQVENVPLTSSYEVGEPVVKEYTEGATLTITCHYLPEVEDHGSLFTIVVPGRDLLFLATEPATYLTES